ncbi:MAG: gliding motility lipoprotein GldH [Saprospiraceae bacterium]|nr:gliding motility lipoprotein GldH [Saprospiraceae bacterium]
MRILATICLIVSFASCGPEVYYEKSSSIEELGWSYLDTLSYSLRVDDTERLNNIHLTVEHSTEYKYQNIYFNINTVFPDASVKTERLSVDLADGKGVWYGKCNSEVCRLKIYLLENFKFQEEGDYVFAISQDTREEMLEGIKTLKFELVESKG